MKKFKKDDICIYNDNVSTLIFIIIGVYDGGYHAKCLLSPKGTSHPKNKKFSFMIDSDREIYSNKITGKKLKLIKALYG